VGLPQRPALLEQLSPENERESVTQVQQHGQIERGRWRSVRAMHLKRLQDGEPSVHANHARVRDGIVVFGPTCMKAGDATIVIERVHAELEAHSRGGQN
jgi:hypothetical protein